MRRFLIAAAITAVSALGLTASSQAASVGTASGNLVVHYLSSAENPTNVAYVSTDSMVFNYDTGLVDAPNAAGYGPDHYFQNHADQFQFDLVLNQLGLGGPVVALNHNTGTTSNVDWAITDPGWNSHLRGGNGDGSSINVTYNSVTPFGTNPVNPNFPAGFHWDIAGYLTLDGQVHWANSPTTSLSIFDNANSPLDGIGASDKIYFRGSFDYVTADDTTVGADTYVGRISFDTAPLAVPVPAAAPAGLLLLGGLAAAKYRRLAPRKA